MSQPRLNIAVFIDFDNIEIGVKSTLGERFELGAVLDAVKERGEVVTKVAYGDWTRAGDYSRMLTTHAVRMVQRNLTPGGDKNGADINLALDALEMAFAHDHINAFVIVGGDSDFITLVEKLKQYDKTVFVVGGRAFTSQIMQKNCHEFIAYENIVGRRPVDRGRALGDAQLAQAMPLVRRALKVLTDREVSAQLGLLKSTLLQLDSAFSERNYGSSTFRDFVQKLAAAGFVNLRGTDRSIVVELRETNGQGLPAAASAAEAAPVPEAGSAPPSEPEVNPALWAEGVRAMQAAFTAATVAPRWPMYLRNLRQFLKAADDTFDERRYGFRGMIDAVRQGQREGLFRVERDRRGVLRVFPGPRLPRASEEMPGEAAGGVGPWSAEASPGADAAPVEPVLLGPEAAATLVDLPAPAGPAEGSAAMVGTPAPDPGSDGEPPRLLEGLDESAPAASKPKRRAPGTGARKTASPRQPRRKKPAATKA